MPLISLGVNATLPGLVSNNTFSPALPINNNQGSLYFDGNDTGEDQSDYLLEISINGISFPAVQFGECGSQDLAIHKYPNLDSARIENTGRNPSEFMIRGIFTNNIYPSPNETWISGSLYPDVFNTVRASLYDTTNPIKTLIHPSLGAISVVVKSWKYDYLGKGPRDGAFLDMLFIETISDIKIVSTISSSATSVATLINAGNSLDNLMIYPNQPPGMNLSGLFSKIANVTSQIMAIPTQVVSILALPIFLTALTSAQIYQNSSSSYNSNNGASFQVKGVNAAQSSYTYNYPNLTSVYSAAYSLNTAQHNNATQFINVSLAFLQSLINFYTSLNNINTASIKLNLYLMVNQLQIIQQNLFKNSNNYSIQQYITQTNTTLISLSNILNNTVDQLISLNPTLNQTLLINAQVPVNYFQS